MRMIIDTDAGIDDAEAILMALTYPDSTVEAITTVTGNVHRDKVDLNVCTILQQAGQTVPIYSGADRPLIDVWEDDERRYHLNDGLGEWADRPPCNLQLEDELAAVALVRLINESPNEIVLVALGPLTNIALAIRLDPTLPEKVKQFVFMGGAVDAHGNTPTVSAEFNIWVDPEAAYIVLKAFKKSVLLGWETTLSHMMSAEDHDYLCHMGTPLARFYEGINAKARARTHYVFKGQHLIPDPLAMAITLEPELILEEETRHVAVELRGEYSRGQTIANYTRWRTDKSNVRIIRKIDMVGVLRIYEDMLR
jgi:purine nucleosidase